MKMEDEHAIILIVTEDALLRKTEADILTKKGFRVIPVGRGKEAIEAIEKNGISVTLIDLDIENVSGLDLLREIKIRKPEIECILVTGFASQESAIKAISLGAFSYLKKPYDMDRLLLIVQHAAEKHRAQRALQDSEAHYRRIFDTAGVSLGEVDFSEVVPKLDALKEQGVSDIRAYFDNHPEVIRELIKHIRIVDVNPTALQLYG
ncbi:MAG: response regulator, partial [Anaerolineales bacterium]|nr:response regulator [Anaerolineales bacterium]